MKQWTKAQSWKKFKAHNQIFSKNVQKLCYEKMFKNSDIEKEFKISDMKN